MSLIVPVICFLLSFPIIADTQLKTQIYDIDYGHMGEDTLVLLTSGHVAKMPSRSTKKMNHLALSKKKKTWVNVSLNDNNEILSLSEAENVFQDAPAPIITAPGSYEPSILSSMDEANQYFSELRYNPKDSQCYNRAMIWGYEWNIHHQFNSKKTWIFFTRKYIRKFDFKWWFHVAPSLQVVEDGIVKEKVMDKKYSSGPRSLTKWTNIFMRNQAECRVVEKFTDYANYPESAWCFVMRTSMYFYQPIDIEMYDLWGTERSNWIDVEIKQAYKEAFDEE